MQNTPVSPTLAAATQFRALPAPFPLLPPAILTSGRPRGHGEGVPEAVYKYAQPGSEKCGHSWHRRQKQVHNFWARFQ